MKSSTQLSDVLHVLLHLAQSPAAVSSEVLATAMRTNPVVLRRLMGGLRQAGWVTSEKGHGGGWRMAVPLEDVTLLDVHQALGAPALLSLGFRDDRPECLVAQVVNESLVSVMEPAQNALLAQFGRITLAELFAGVHQRMTALPRRSAQAAHRLEDHRAQD